MDDKCNMAAISAIGERQRLIAEKMKIINSFFYWSSDLILHSAGDAKDIPKNAWIEPSKNTDWEKWEELLWRKVIPSPHVVAAKNSIISSLAAALINKSNNPAEIRKRAESLAYLEWQLKQITFWASPSKEPKRTWKRFDLLACQRQFIRDYALEAICFYQCGAHDALNDFERYSSTALADWDCSRLFENAYHKMLACVKVYEVIFNESISQSKRGGQKTSPEPLTTWLNDQLAKDGTVQPKFLWEQISKDELNATRVGDDGQLWIFEKRCYFYDYEDPKSIGRGRFGNLVKELKQKTKK